MSAVSLVSTEVPTSLANMALLGNQLKQTLPVKCALTEIWAMEGAVDAPPKVVNS